MHKLRQTDFNNYLIETMYDLLLFSPKEILVDLHTHSNYSDGALPPKDLFQYAIENRINVLAITDHNTIKGVIDGINIIKKKKINRENSLHLIPGIELSTDFDQHLLDVTGLFIDIYNWDLNKLIERIINGHYEKAKIQLSKLEKIGMNINYEEYKEFLGGHVPNWKTMAEAIVICGYANNIKEAKERFTNKGRPGYVSHNENWSKINISDAIVVIKKAGGLSFIAHLGDVEKTLGIERTKKLILSLKELGLSGADLSNRGRLHSEPSNEILNFVKEKDLITIRGSDFHSKANERLGAFQINKEEINRLIFLKMQLYIHLLKNRLELLSFKDLRFFPIHIIPDNIFNTNTGFRDILLKNNIHTSYDLCMNLQDKYKDVMFLDLCFQSLIAILKNVENETFLKEVLLNMDLKKIQELIVKRIKTTNNIPIREDIDELKKEFLKDNIHTYSPIAYRLCFYDIGFKLKEESMIRLFPKLWSDLYNEYIKIINMVFNIGIDDLEKYIRDKEKEFASIFSNEGYQDIKIHSRIKPLISFYDKLKISYFVGYNPKITAHKGLVKVFLNKLINFRKGLLRDNINDKEFGSFCEDLIGFRIIFKSDGEITEYNNLLYIANKLIKNPNIIETKPRKWHHKRLIIWGWDEYLLTELPVEIQIMTWVDYLLARAYYWYPKGIHIYPELWIFKTLEDHKKLESRLKNATYEDIHKIMIAEISDKIQKEKGVVTC